MSREELIAVLEEGLKNGRISPHLAAYIAAELLDVEVQETEYVDWALSEDLVPA